ncbi:MAG TPA: SDR family NAD(P)-dependent oxidoreductase, partial [Actinomycetales bacterium]|nr:SDR family NAD(P)-dependent oxidoreductase [Actinomycetales bacterium]
MARFTRRCAVVTGGAGGIGREVCAALAAEGALVGVVDTQADAVAETVGSLRASGARAEGYVVDVRDAGAVTELM